MKRIIALLILTAFMMGCKGETDTNNTEKDPIAVDTMTTDSSNTVAEDADIILTPKIDMDAFKAKFQDEIDLPFQLDSVQIIQYRSKDKNDSYNLEGKEINYLSTVFTQDFPTQRTTHYLEVFSEVDSIKRFGDYEAYQENLDIGMTRYSHANSIGFVQISNDLTVYIWSLDYASYEACPHSHGTFVYGSLFYQDQFQNTVLIGEESGGGDPPVWGETAVAGELSSQGLYTDFMDVYGEYTDTGENEIQNKTEKHNEFAITSTGFEMVSGEN